VLWRLLRSIISIFLVTTIAYLMIFSMIPKKVVFSEDPAYSKLTAKLDLRTDYENTIYKKLGYIDYLDSKSLEKKVAEEDKSVSVNVSSKNKKTYEKWAENECGDWKILQFPISKKFYAVRDISLVERVWRFYSHLIQIDTPWRVQDKENPNLKRGYQLAKDEAGGGFALIGSGTKYKYQLYFDNRFPFIHQNIVKLYLGESYPTFYGYEVLEVLTNGQGEAASKEVTFPTGEKQMSPVNLHTAQYQPLSKMDKMTKQKFGKDPYSKTNNFYKDPSMLSISLFTEVISLVLIYLVGLPLAMLMARFKFSLLDRLGTGMITGLISIPSLAIIYFLRFLGSSIFEWPDMFPTLGAHNILSYVLPILILTILNITNIVMWTRRYMVDQQSADYVKFARAKGLSEKEISRHHILKNALIPIVQGIPLSIVITIQGATMTETIFAMPGMGKMLPDAILRHNHSMIIGLVFLFTSVSVFAVFIGDLLMTFIDPRIRLNTKGGK
jgi:oligopeptide transport system permease protein